MINFEHLLHIFLPKDDRIHRKLSLLCLFILYFLPVSCTSQNSQGLSDSDGSVLHSMGIRIDAPQGWTFTTKDDGYAYTSPDEKMAIVVSADKEYSFEQYLQILPAGIDLGNGTTMISNGPVKLLNVQKAHSEISLRNTEGDTKMWVGLWKTNNRGLIIFLAIAEHEKLLQSVSNKLVRILNSAIEVNDNNLTSLKAENTNPAVTSSKQEQFGQYSSQLLRDWHETLSPCRLTYMSSGGGYGGMSSSTVIELCSDGSFYMHDQGVTSASVEGWSASDSWNDEYIGRWNLRQQDELAVLVLIPDQGEKMEFGLSYENRKFYLNTTRYYKTGPGDGNHAPNCN